MYFEIFNFNNYSMNQIDALNFIFAYLACLAVTYYGWKIKNEFDINSLIIKVIIMILIAAEIVYESYDTTPYILGAKMIFTYTSCIFLYWILDKSYNGY